MITSERMEEELIILMNIKLVHYHHHKIQSSGPVYFRL
jgi:hypothetical protein